MFDRQCRYIVECINLISREVVSSCRGITMMLTEGFAQPPEHRNVPLSYSIAFGTRFSHLDNQFPQEFDLLFFKLHAATPFKLEMLITYTSRRNRVRGFRLHQFLSGIKEDFASKKYWRHVSALPTEFDSESPLSLEWTPH